MTRNISASVRQRLLNLARLRNEEFGLVLTKYALERILYRLSTSKHRDVFTLKGALLFELWTQERHRPTRDLDFLASGLNSVERFVDIFQEICSSVFEEDGLRFDAEKIRGERIKEDADYEGVRLQFEAYLGNVRIPVQIDIGFGDVITPAPIQVVYPTLLELPPPRLSAYPKETVVAEKCEAIVKLGMANSRMKDFHDIWRLSCLFDFEADTLIRAVRETFLRRQTNLPAGRPIAFTKEFYEDESKRQQWNGFTRKNRLYIEQQELSEIAISVAGFVMPVLQTLSGAASISGVWRAGGSWTA